MRLAIGGLLLFIAASLAWTAFNWSYNSVQASQKTGIEGVTSWMVDEQKKSQDVAIMTGVGSAIFGVLGMVLLCTRIGGDSSNQEVIKSTSDSASDSKRLIDSSHAIPKTTNISIEERLAILKGLLSKGLISEQEYQSKRRNMLENL